VGYITKTSKQKAEDKLAKLEKEGRYRDGHYYSKGGTATVLGYWENDKFIEPEGGHKVVVEPRIVDTARLNKFHDLWDNMIRSHFPARYVWGAMMDNDDLVSKCREETMRALSETFDPDKMLSGVSFCKSASARVKRYADEKELCRDFEKIMEVAERGWVKGRISCALRRAQYDFHPQQLGGYTQSLSIISEERSNNNEMKMNLFYETALHSPEAVVKSEELFAAVERLGPKRARNLFFGMSRSVREEIIEIIQSKRDRSQDVAMAEEHLQELMGTNSNWADPVSESAMA
jgi:hypothetical protein